MLQIGPDPSIGGGMSASIAALLDSPLRERYRLDFIATYRSPSPPARLLRFGLALGQMAAWSLRGRGRIVHVHATVRGSAYRKAVATLLAGPLLRRRVILHVHSGAGDIAFFRGGRGRLSLALFRAAFRAADAVLAVSTASAEALREAGVEAEIAVVPNPAPSVADFERPAAVDGGVRAAYLGGFANRAKGSDVLVEALSVALPLEPGLRVTMAGPGEPDADARRLMEAEARVSWEGWLEPSERDRLLRDAEVFVMPSRSEGLPMALLEAMAYGTAVLSTEAGGIPELVEDGVDGLLVPPEDADALVAGLRRLAGDPALRARLGAAARERARRLDAVVVSGRLADLYAELG